eukprot:gene5180-5255_t
MRPSKSIMGPKKRAGRDQVRDHGDLSTESDLSACVDALGHALSALSDKLNVEVNFSVAPRKIKRSTACAQQSNKGCRRNTTHSGSPSMRTSSPRVTIEPPLRPRAPLVAAQSHPTEGLRLTSRSHSAPPANVCSLGSTSSTALPATRPSVSRPVGATSRAKLATKY